MREKARELTGAETVLVINTHYHLDHTYGNPAFEPGTRVLSTERTLSHLKALDADFWSGDAAELLPNETFADRQTLTIGGKTLELVHPGRGHTQFRTFMVQLGEIDRRAAAEKISLENTLATDQLTADAGYVPIRFIISLGLDREFVLRRAWEEATGNFTVAN
ncbi:MAG: MBL fold metallo-hydrolase [Pseudomonadales bacterium]